MQNGFENLIVWQKAKDISVDVYKLFRHSKDYGFRDQIQRAAVSIMNNIAEGYERKSRKEFTLFLSHSKGSCGEVRSMLVLGKELGYFDEMTYSLMYSKSVEVSKILAALITKYKAYS